jgi:hypothetical protein
LFLFKLISHLIYHCDFNEFIARLEYERSSSIGTDKEFLYEQKRGGDDKRNDVQRNEERKGNRRGDFDSMRRDDRRNEGAPVVRASRGREKYRERDEWEKKGGNRDRDRETSGRLAGSDKAREIRRGLVDKIKDDARRLVSRRGVRGEYNDLNVKQHTHAVRSSDRTFNQGNQNSSPGDDGKRRRGNSRRRSGKNDDRHDNRNLEDNNHNQNSRKRVSNGERHNGSSGNYNDSNRNNDNDNDYDSHDDSDNINVRSYNKNNNQDDNNYDNNGNNNNNNNFDNNNHNNSGNNDNGNNNDNNNNGHRRGRSNKNKKRDHHDYDNNGTNNNDYDDNNNYDDRHNDNNSNQQNTSNDYHRNKRHNRNTERSDPDQNAHDRTTQQGYRQVDEYNGKSVSNGNGNGNGNGNVKNDNGRNRNSKRTNGYF